MLQKTQPYTLLFAILVTFQITKCVVWHHGDVIVSHPQLHFISCSLWLEDHNTARSHHMFCFTWSFWGGGQVDNSGLLL